MTRRLHFVALASLLCLPALGRAQVAPDKAVATFTVVDPLELTLWASEEQGFVNPTCIDVDHKGRVWVCESVNYRCTLHHQPLKRPEGDRIVILEDSKGEGKADKATVFYQSPEILAPLGIAVAKDPVGPGYKVFVCQSPDILAFEDKEGKGKADGPPKKLLTGFNGIDHDHGVHGILIGPDMKLYFSIGDPGVQDLQSSDGKGRKFTSNETDVRAGTIWRCDLDGTNLELIAHNFRNEYEPCVDSFGTVFVSDNDDDGQQQTRICYVMPGGDYGYHVTGKKVSHWNEELPGIVPKILRTGFGAPTGMCVYEGTLLPKKYWGQPIHTDAGPRQLRCYHLTPDGASYAVDREDMVNSTDTWFRPSDVCVGPDGSLYVADWYDPGVGGHGIGDWTRGRIYRVAPKGVKPSAPKVDLESKEGVLEALASPNLATRYMAMAKLHCMKAEDALELLAYGFKTVSDPPVVARIFQHAYRIGSALPYEKRPRALNLAMVDFASQKKDPRFGPLIVRTIKDVDGTYFPENPPEKWNDDKTPPAGSIAEAREMLLSLRDDKPEKVRKYIYKLMKQYDGKDRFYLEAIGIAVNKHDKARREIILKDFDKEFPEWNDKVADLVWELHPPAMMAALGKRLADPALPPLQRGRIVDILAASDDKDAGVALLKVLQSDAPREVRDKVIDNLRLFLPNKWQDLRQSKELNETVQALLDKPETRATGLNLIAVAEKTDLLSQVTKVAADAKEADAVRIAAVQALGALPSHDGAVVLAQILTSAPPPLRAETVQSLGKLAQRKADQPGAALALKALEVAFADDDQDAGLRAAVAAVLAGNHPGTVWLLEQEEKKQTPEALRPDVARLLRNTPFQDLHDKAVALFPLAGKIDPKKLPAIAALVTRQGDAARGKQLLAASVKSDMQCLKCHTVRGVGGAVGPDLSVIGKKASRDNLYESILYPSKAIADQYVAWKVETTQGLALTGLLVEETPTGITLRDANGKDTKIDKKDIDTRAKSLVSLMPADVVATMSEDDLVDVVEYLFSLKTPVLGMDWWHIVGPFDNGSGDAGLEQVFPPEKAIDFQAAYPGKAGKVSWRTVKPDVQGYVDLQAFYAPNSDEIVSYLTREVESPADQEATVQLGTDDCGKLWVNDELAYTNRAHRAAAPEQDSVKVKLKKGKNRLLLKITNGNGAHGFYLTLTADQELKRVEEK